MWLHLCFAYFDSAGGWGVSVNVFYRVVAGGKIQKNDAIWFPRWVRRYAVFLKQGDDAPLLVTETSVKAFCRSLLPFKVPAWQRLQGVRAIEFYRTELLKVLQQERVSD